MDSQSPTTAAKVCELLNGQRVDLLFIDGDHTYAGVKQDFDLYSPFMRTGGLVALHDIAPRLEHPSIEVWKFWEELKARGPVHEALDQTPNGRAIGIGMIDWRSAA